MDKIRVRVTGPLEIAGVATGDVVELDPGNVNIAALIEAGHVEPVAETKPAKKPTTRGE